MATDSFIFRDECLDFVVQTDQVMVGSDVLNTLAVKKQDELSLLPRMVTCDNFSSKAIFTQSIVF